MFNDCRPILGNRSTPLRLTRTSDGRATLGSCSSCLGAKSRRLGCAERIAFTRQCMCGADQRLGQPVKVVPRGFILGDAEIGSVNDLCNAFKVSFASSRDRCIHRAYVHLCGSTAPVRSATPKCPPRWTVDIRPRAYAQVSALPLILSPTIIDRLTFPVHFCRYGGGSVYGRTPMGGSRTPMGGRSAYQGSTAYGYR